MKIQILDEAKQDLVEGFRFYENQEPGLGSYFLTNLYADIESLKIHAGVITSLTNIIIAYFLIGFRLLSFTKSN